MVDLVLVISLVICAFMAIRANRLLVSALWLAGCSALVAVTLASLGAAQAAVIELSVGAGLVTVLFVFAIAISGDDAIDGRSLVPRPLAALLVVLSLTLLAAFNLPAWGIHVPATFPGPGMASFTTVLWQERSLDVLIQVVLIFSGILSALGLIGEPGRPGFEPAAGRSHETDVSNVRQGVQP